MRASDPTAAHGRRPRSTSTAAPRPTAAAPARRTACSASTSPRSRPAPRSWARQPRPDELHRIRVRRRPRALRDLPAGRLLGGGRCRHGTRDRPTASCHRRRRPSWQLFGDNARHVAGQPRRGHRIRERRAAPGHAADSRDFGSAESRHTHRRRSAPATASVSLEVLDDRLRHAVRGRLPERPARAVVLPPLLRGRLGRNAPQLIVDYTPAALATPSLIQVVATGGTGAFVIGRVDGAANAPLTLAASTAPTCTAGALPGGGTPAGGPISVTTDEDGYFGAAVSGVTPGDFVTVRVTSPSTTAASACLVSSGDNDFWPKALTLTGSTVTARDFDRLARQGTLVQVHRHARAADPGRPLGSPGRLRPGRVQGHRPGVRVAASAGRRCRADAAERGVRAVGLLTVRLLPLRLLAVGVQPRRVQPLGVLAVGLQPERLQPFRLLARRSSRRRCSAPASSAPPSSRPRCSRRRSSARASSARRCSHRRSSAPTRSRGRSRARRPGASSAFRRRRGRATSPSSSTPGTTAAASTSGSAAAAARSTRAASSP